MVGGVVVISKGQGDGGGEENEERGRVGKRKRVTLCEWRDLAHYITSYLRHSHYRISFVPRWFL